MNRRTFVTSLSAVLAVVALGVLAAGAYMAHTGGALLPFRWVDVSGPFVRVSPEQIRAAVGPAAARGFFGVDLAEVRASALSLPWVAEAEVRKVWPDTLELRVSERRVLGRLGVDRLVDIAGNVFQARGAGETRGLPLLEAEPAQMAQLVDYYLQAQRDVDSIGRQISAARLTPRGALELKLSDGLEVQLGSHEQVQRWRRFVASVPRLAALDPRPIAAVDLRYTHGYAVRYAEPAPNSAPAPSIQPEEIDSVGDSDGTTAFLPDSSPTAPVRERSSLAFGAAGACAGSRCARPRLTPEHRGGGWVTRLNEHRETTESSNDT